MAAFEIPSLRFSGNANTALARRRFLMATNDDGFGYATPAEYTVGVSMNNPAINEVVEVADGIVMVEAGDVLTVGMQIQVGSDGKAAPYDAGIVVGTALTAAGASGELATIKLH
jgi:hypothetical protein